MLVHSNCSVSKHANKTTRTANQNQPRRSKTVVMALLLLKPNLHKNQQTIWYLLNTQQHTGNADDTHTHTGSFVAHTRNSCDFFFLLPCELLFHGGGGGCLCWIGAAEQLYHFDDGTPHLPASARWVVMGSKFMKLFI